MSNRTLNDFSDDELLEELSRRKAHRHEQVANDLAMNNHRVIKMLTKLACVENTDIKQSERAFHLGSLLEEIEVLVLHNHFEWESDYDVAKSMLTADGKNMWCDFDAFEDASNWPPRLRLQLILEHQTISDDV